MKIFTLVVMPAAALFVLVFGVAAPAKAGLVGYYRFDDAVNLGLDSSGFRNDLTTVTGGGVAYSTNSFSGGALSLSGQGGLSTASGMVPTAFPIGNSAYTLAVSFDANVVGSRMGFLGWGNYGSPDHVNAFRLGLGGADGTLLNYWWGPDLLTNTVTINPGTWYTAVASFDGTTRDLYLNGVLVAQDTPTGHVSSGNNFAVGITNGNEYFNGLLDNVAIFNNALTPAQVTAAEAAASVPEPASALAFTAGLTGLTLLRRRGAATARS